MDENAIASLQGEIFRLQTEVDRCHARLEIDHHTVFRNGEPICVEIPYFERIDEEDGIACRDATIQNLEQQLEALRNKRTEEQQIIVTLENCLYRYVDRVRVANAAPEYQQTIDTAFANARDRQAEAPVAPPFIKVNAPSSREETSDWFVATAALYKQRLTCIATGDGNTYRLYFEDGYLDISTWPNALHTTEIENRLERLRKGLEYIQQQHPYANLKKKIASILSDEGLYRPYGQEAIEAERCRADQLQKQLTYMEQQPTADQVILAHEAAKQEAYAEVENLMRTRAETGIGNVPDGISIQQACKLRNAALVNGFATEQRIASDARAERRWAEQNAQA